MKVVLISDTHEHHNLLGDFFPEADVFVHAGDFTMIGEENWVKSFNDWLGRLPYQHKLVIAGNHDRSFDRIGALEYGQSKLTNATYLCNTGVEIDGKKFWGSPYTPFFHSAYWKFHYHPNEARGTWAQIPANLDLLITHGPPLGVLDKTFEGSLAGCPSLRWRLDDLIDQDAAPKHHVFGYIHDAYGDKEFQTIQSHNVAAVDRMYRLRPNPWKVIEL
jgi:hypothetical protein